MPATATLKVLLSELGFVTVTVFEPPAVPPIVTSVRSKPVTGSSKTAVNSIGDAFVGSVWPAFWLIVTLGAVASTVTAFGNVSVGLGLVPQPGSLLYPMKYALYVPLVEGD